MTYDRRSYSADLWTYLATVDYRHEQIAADVARTRRPRATTERLDAPRWHGLFHRRGEQVGAIAGVPQETPA